MHVVVQEARIDPVAMTAQCHASAEPGQSGAFVTFAGTVRDFQGAAERNFVLSHYPGMTERVLERIAQSAESRWPLDSLTLVHRVGAMSVGECIVFIAVASPHRAAAFAACEFLIDTLKTEAPFWKKEGDEWVDANEADAMRSTRWLTDTP